jgi:hypothetical protein
MHPSDHITTQNGLAVRRAVCMYTAAHADGEQSVTLESACEAAAAQAQPVAARPATYDGRLSPERRQAWADLKGRMADAERTLADAFAPGRPMPKLRTYANDSHRLSGTARALCGFIAVLVLVYLIVAVYLMVTT